VADDHADAELLLRRRHDVLADHEIEQREDDGRVVLDLRQVADALGDQCDHVLEALVAPAGKSAQPAAKIVVQHHVPSPEELFGQKVGSAAEGRDAGGVEVG
jgi:hypothetical protein